MPTTILIAEDDPDLLRLVALVLRTAGHTVLQAADGAEALAVAERERPDLIVSDVMMPGLSGVALAATLRAREDGHRPPILLMSGAVLRPAMPPHTAFLAKPFSVDDLLRAVAALLPAAAPR